MNLSPVYKSALTATILTIALYFSGLLYFLTPLPFIYHQLKYRDFSFFPLVAPSLIFMTGIYFFGLETFNTLYKNHPMLVLFIPVPLTGLTDFFPRLAIALAGVGFFGLFLTLSHLVARALKSETKKCFRISLWSITSLFILIGALLTLTIIPHAGTFLADFKTYLTVGFEHIISAQEKAGLSLKNAAGMRNAFPTYVEFAFFLTPVMLFALVTFFFTLNLLVAKRLFSPLFTDLRELNLTLFKLPFELVWVALGIVAIFIIHNFRELPLSLHYTVLNLFFCLVLAYFFQGLAVLVHFFNRKNVLGLWRVIIYFFLILMFLNTFLVLALLGFFDNWLDTRKLDKAQKTVA